MLASRISYCFDFKGPCRIVNAECASSAVAIHEARTSLLNGECDAAIVGGVNLLLRPGISQSFAKLNMLSSDGKCKAFDESGAGYVRSEAVAVCLLTAEDSTISEKEQDTLEREVFHYAKVVGSGATHGGYQKAGLLYPNIETQQQLLHDVYRDARISPKDLTYIEAHGTGE